MTRFYLCVAFLLLTTSAIHGRVERFANDEAIKLTIQSKDGDVIDCYDIYQQPALKHPLLKDHKLQLKPNKKMDELLGPSTSQVNQIWTLSGTCPEGTVPIRRTSQNNNISGFSFPFAQLVQMNDNGTPQAQLEAVLDYSIRGPYFGANAQMTLWDPHVEPNEYSHTFISVVGVQPGITKPNLPLDNINYQISLGWIVWPAYYKDSLPRLHLYHTLDGGETSCVNHECKRFVLTNNTITLGASIAPVSKVGGQINEIGIVIHRDVDDIKWWLSYNHVPFGYFTKEAVNGWYYGSMNVRGGLVLNTKAGGKHTSTQMGSGRYPAEGEGNSAAFHDFSSINNAGQMTVDPPTRTVITKPNCYKYIATTEHAASFLYGGPGGAGCDS